MTRTSSRRLRVPYVPAVAASCGRSWRVSRSAFDRRLISATWPARRELRASLSQRVLLPRTTWRRWATSTCRDGGVTAVSKGFSGEGYEGWVEEPAQRVRISDVRMVDPAAAELTLDDGRTILVDLTGERVEGEAGRAVITISLSDPALAEMDVDELRARLRLLPPASWCSHWRDRELTSQARVRAADEARQSLDAWTDEDEALFQAQLPPGMDRTRPRRCVARPCCTEPSSRSSKTRGASEHRACMSPCSVTHLMGMATAGMTIASRSCGGARPPN